MGRCELLPIGIMSSWTTWSGRRMIPGAHSSGLTRPAQKMMTAAKRSRKSSRKNERFSAPVTTNALREAENRLWHNKHHKFVEHNHHHGYWDTDKGVRVFVIMD